MFLGNFTIIYKIHDAEGGWVQLKLSTKCNNSGSEVFKNVSLLYVYSTA